MSDTTHTRAQLIAVGTMINRGQDLATKGNVHVFEILNVVPEPGKPYTNRKLRQYAKEEVKGAVSALSELGMEGYMVMTQGQKAMVRGLQDDGVFLPVAFMDLQIHVTDMKNLPGTGYLLIGDALRGLWFVGYTVSPCRPF
jgi:cleavage and polyadenylation specificity factor subunit 1